MLSAQKKVLIIDDDDDAIENLKKLLIDQTNFRVVGSITDSTLAVEAIRQHKPDLIFLDIQMPGMNGLEILNEIRKNDKLKNIKCVAFTAQDKFQNKSFKDLGFDDVLIKPINPRTFTSFIKRLFD